MNKSKLLCYFFHSPRKVFYIYCSNLSCNFLTFMLLLSKTLFSPFLFTKVPHPFLLSLLFFSLKYALQWFFRKRVSCWTLTRALCQVHASRVALGLSQNWACRQFKWLQKSLYNLLRTSGGPFLNFILFLPFIQWLLPSGGVTCWPVVAGSAGKHSEHGPRTCRTHEKVTGSEAAWTIQILNK